MQYGLNLALDLYQVSRYLFSLSLYEDELMSAPIIIMFLPNLRLGNEKVTCILGKITYPEQ